MGVLSLKRHYVGGGLGGFSHGGDIPEVHVKDGKIIRIRPAYFEDAKIYEIRARGKIFKRPPKSLITWFDISYKKRVFSPNRVKYPLKQVDLDPENRNPQNRGKSKFVRISWDEALDIITSEIERIRETYESTTPILVQAEGHGQSGGVHTLHFYAHKLFEKLGGYTWQIRNPDSWEGYYWGAMHVWGFGGAMTVGLPFQDAVLEDILENTEMLLAIGCDPETTGSLSGQCSSIFWKWFKQAGIKIVAVSPDCNFTSAIHADRWIPILPNTDAALYQAIAYTWIKEGTYDKRYVETHCVGFEDFKKLILGEQDGIPKSPEWAEKITRVPARTIKALAREWARKRTSLAIMCGGPKIRGPYSHETARLEAICMAMQGLGAPGRQMVQLLALVSRVVTPIPHYPEVAATRYVNPVTMYGLIVPPFPIFCVPKVLVPDAILNPPISWHGSGAQSANREDQFRKYVFPPEGHPGIRAIWNENSCYTTCWNGKIIEAFRSPKIEFIVTIHPWLENDAIFADLVLPAQTIYEHDDIAICDRSDLYMVAYQEKCIDPVGESKSDYEIHRMIAQRLGVDDDFPPPEEFIRMIYESTPPYKVFGISFEEFKRRKLIVVPQPSWEEWKEIKRKAEVMPGITFKPGLTWFYELPEGKGLDTPTGKIEIVSTGLAKHFPSDNERPPLPRYIPYGETHQESLLHPRAKKYSLLLVSNHARWRFHAQGDDITWLREIPTCKVRGPDGYLYEPIWIHPIDALKRGIKTGDIVKVYNERGAILCGAYVTERIIPGSVLVHHGSRVDLITINPLMDRGGAINLIVPSKTTSKNTVGMVCSGILVEVEKIDILKLMKEYPEAFKRKLHTDAGQCYETWVIG